MDWRSGRTVSFKEIYRTEVLQSRRDRSRRAFFWARIMGLALMVTIGATLRSEPELRRALAGAGMDAVMQMAGHQPPTVSVAQADHDPNLPTSRVKVNRIGDPANMLDDAPSSQIIAQELARTLAAQRPGE